MLSSKATAFSVAFFFYSTETPDANELKQWRCHGRRSSYGDRNALSPKSGPTDANSAGAGGHHWSFGVRQQTRLLPSLEDGFQNPPPQLGPHCRWWWLKGGECMKKSSVFAGGACFLALTLLGLSAIGLGQAKKSGSPEKNLPPNITQLTGFGERASWSPDGKRIAFMSKSFGDAFEIDLDTKLTRLLTGHFLHKGFLRVQYLPNGDFFLIGARTFEDIRTTRSRDQEMWVLKVDAKEPPVPLNHKISEGVAISRKQMKIAWSNTRGQYPDQLAEGESVIYTADLVYKNGMPTLENKQEVIRAKTPECTLEAQDFRNNDTELVYVCYR